MTRSTITPHRRAGSRPGDEGHRVTRCRGFGVSRFRGGASSRPAGAGLWASYVLVERRDFSPHSPFSHPAD
jgi:hypothetical protein